MLLTGCATWSALQKVEPPEKLLRYDSVCISEENELTFNFTVRLKDIQKEETWCAKLPLEKVIKYSTVVNETIPVNSSESEGFYNSLYAISASNYSIIKSNCSCANVNKIPYLYHGIGWTGEKILWGEKSAPIKFILPQIHVRKMDYGYIVFKAITTEPIGTIKVTKIELPLPEYVYDTGKIVLLPFYIVFDIALTPVYLFFIIFGKGYF
jgi:hypothetical protein